MFDLVERVISFGVLLSLPYGCSGFGRTWRTFKDWEEHLKEALRGSSLELLQGHHIIVT